MTFTFKFNIRLKLNIKPKLKFAWSAASKINISSKSDIQSKTKFCTTLNSQIECENQSQIQCNLQLLNWISAPNQISKSKSKSKNFWSLTSKTKLWLTLLFFKLQLTLMLAPNFWLVSHLLSALSLHQRWSWIFVLYYSPNITFKKYQGHLWILNLYNSLPAIFSLDKYCPQIFDLYHSAKWHWAYTNIACESLIYTTFLSNIEPPSALFVNLWLVFFFGNFQFISMLAVINIILHYCWLLPLNLHSSTSNHKVMIWKIN